MNKYYDRGNASNQQVNPDINTVEIAIHCINEPLLTYLHYQNDIPKITISQAMQYKDDEIISMWGTNLIQASSVRVILSNEWINDEEINAFMSIL